MFIKPNLKTMQPQQPDFWHYFLSLFFDVTPDFKRFVASVVGAALGLTFFKPHDWVSGFLQVLTSYLFSHYLSNAILKWKNIDAEGLRFVLGFGGIAIARGFAKLFRGFEGNPEKSISLLDKLIEAYQKWKHMSPPTDHDQQP